MRYRPTVFLVLNKLLLFGTKIVTLFGQRKNVFVKQKHSGQNVKCAVHEKTTVCGNTSVLFFLKLLISLVRTPNLQPWGFVYQETNLKFLNMCERVTTVHYLSVEVLFPLTALDVVW